MATTIENVLYALLTGIITVMMIGCGVLILTAP